MSLGQALAALWAILLLIAYLRVGDLPRWRGVSALRAAGVVFALALAVRLLPNLLLPVGAGYDVESYRIVGGLLARGADVYSSPLAEARHPYLPLQMYWMAAALRLSDGLHLPFLQVVRLQPILADALIAAVCCLAVASAHDTARGWRAGLAYCLNPLPVLVCAYHGQFDAVPALLALVAALTVDRRPVLAGASIGLGILSKSWPALLLPALIWQARGWRAKSMVATGAVLVPAVGVLAYCLALGASPGEVLRRALSYNWGVGVWGYTYLVRLPSLLGLGGGGAFAWLVANGRYITLAALAVVWLVRARREAAVAGALTILVAFFAVTHAFSIQYLMWLVPFAVVALDRRWLSRFTVAAFAYMFLVYNTLIFSPLITRLLPWPQADWFVIIPAGLPAWSVVVAWLWHRLRRSDDERGMAAVASCAAEAG